MPINQTQQQLIATFIGSLLLSALAYYFNPILARDSTLYIDIANNFAAHGYANPTERFDWLWMSVLISIVHQLSGLSTINTALLLMALLMAVTCTLLTRTSQLLTPASGWWACLISLSIPAFNSYRDNILREPGQWFAAALTMLAVILWQEKKQWRYLLLAIAAVITGSLFRLEAIFLLAPLVITFLWQLRANLLSKQGLIFIAITTLAVAFAASIVIASGLLDSSRAAYYINLLDPALFTTNLEANANSFAEATLKKYSHDDAAKILVIGFLGLIMLKAILMNGPFIAALALSPSSLLKRPANPLELFVVIGILCYLMILLVFAVQHRFMIDRYIAMLHILATPLLAASTVKVKKIYPKLAKLVVLFAVLSGLDNVISLSDKRTHYLDAGPWIQDNIPAEARSYYSDGRVSFYAGRTYVSPRHDESIAISTYSHDYDYFIIDNLHENTAAQEALANGSLELLAEFDNGARRHLAILKKSN